MASNYTSNYRLNQWAASDKVLRTEFNADNAKIETALAGLESSKATVAALNGKADQSALAALQSTVKSHTSKLELRNCRMVQGSYSGSGEYGKEHPVTLSFNGKPVFLFVATSSYFGYFSAVAPQNTVWHYVLGEQMKQVVTWGNNSVSWYNVPHLSGASAERQLNKASTTYYYVALTSPS